MSGSVRIMAAGLSDAALETLASKGLVRRANADVEAGKAVVVSRSDAEVVVEIDGETATLQATGPTAGRCTCPAPGVCRHRLAGLILLRGEDLTADVSVSDAPETFEAVAPVQAPPVEVDWATVIGDITADGLIRFSSTASLRAAVRGIEPDAPVEVRPDGQTLHIVVGDAPPVLLNARGDLSAAVTRAPPRKRVQVILQAILAARPALGLPPLDNLEDAALDQADPDSGGGGDAETLLAVLAALREIMRSGLALPSRAAEDQLRALAVRGRVEVMPRLSRVLVALAADLGRLRQRLAGAEIEVVHRDLVHAYALTTAILRAADPATRQALVGQVRRSFDAVEDKELIGLGAHLWSAPSGAHGVTAYFHDIAANDILSVALARGDRKDTVFDPTDAFHQAPVWGLSMERVCASSVTLSGAKMADRAASPTSGAASTVAWKPERRAVAAWSCAFSDWALLEAALSSRLTGSLTSPALPRLPAILAFTRTAQLQWDEAGQRAIWPVADERGRWLGLELPFDTRSGRRINALERALKASPWAVLITARLKDQRIHLEPYAVWGETQTLLDFNAPQPAWWRPDKTTATLQQRLQANRRPDRFRPRLSASAAERLLDEAWSLLQQTCEQSGPDAAGLEALELISGRLRQAGLPRIAEALDRGLSGDDYDAILAASWAVLTAREGLSRLDWLTE